MLEIADTPMNGTKTAVKGRGTETITGDMIVHRRLQVDTREWMLARALPKVCGDRIQSVSKHQMLDENEKPTDLIDLARHIAFLLAAAQHAPRKAMAGTKPDNAAQ